MNIYRKLPDGGWGVQCHHSQVSGDVVTVTKRNGGTKMEVLGEQVGAYNAEKIFRIVKRDDNAPRRGANRDEGLVWFRTHDEPRANGRDRNDDAVARLLGDR